ncbi:MAG: helix-turn-helix domain-containing protein [Rhodobacteraceae bacterium]|nr:helix-turn-helix domain-containing protein [Paracoccaceae bacterium]
MTNRANPMAVKSALTYDVNEAAATLGKTPATIRNWVKDGLRVMHSRKSYLISGLAIREYLRAKYKTAKRPLGPEGLFCPGCGDGRKPLDMAVTISPMTERTSLLKGNCSHCGGVSTRMISKAKVADFARTFNIKEAAGSVA